MLNVRHLWRRNFEHRKTRNSFEETVQVNLATFYEKTPIRREKKLPFRTKQRQRKILYSSSCESACQLLSIPAFDHRAFETIFAVWSLFCPLTFSNTSSVKLINQVTSESNNSWFGQQKPVQSLSFSGKRKLKTRKSNYTLLIFGSLKCYSRKRRKNWRSGLLQKEPFFVREFHSMSHKAKSRNFVIRNTI